LPSVDWQHNCLRLVDTKTGPRTVPVSSQVMTLLQQIHDQTGSPRQGYVVHSRTGRKLTSLNATWTSLRKAAGIPDVRLHDLRHSFASDALMGGVPLAIVGEMLGHREPATTKRYAHLADRVVREAIEHTTGRIVAAEQTVTLALPVDPFRPMRDDQWALVEGLVKPKHGVGGKPVDYRMLVDGIRWVLHNGAHWQDMPRTYGATTTCWRWYGRLCESGAWAQIEALLQARPEAAPRQPRPRPRPAARAAGAVAPL
jgi:transposase